ncbi:MAG: sulfate adenylyltransferase [Alphaproteobacteria bacterium]|nr:sulfate adenylyltransferase [Alphaproteobacteria bacterium]
MSDLVRPHGATSLKPLLLPEAERVEEIKRARTLKRVALSSREVSDLFMLAMGAYTPLAGFMGEQDWRSCCADMVLSDGLFWPIPITLSCDQDVADSIGIGEKVALVDRESAEVLGVLTVGEKYRIDKQLECSHVYRTTDPAHPGVLKVLEQGPVNLAGPVVALSEGHFPATYPGLYYRPAETRTMFQERGWSKVAAFQTRNPMHRSHEHLVKIAVEICDGVLIHQVLGALKPGDIPADVRVQAVDALVRRYFVPGTVVQAGYPIEMRYAGPREALLHAVFRQNFGCSHLIIGRDHAGVGKYYGPFDAHRIFDTLAPGSMEIQPLKIDVTFYCFQCAGMATGRTCPHDAKHQLSISGTRLREMFARHEDIPREFSRPEVIEILQAYYDRLK